MKERNTIVSLGGEKFGYRSEARDGREPILRTWIWPLVNCRIEGMRGAPLMDAVEKPMFDAQCIEGRVSCYLGDSAWFRAEMPEGGSTKALSIAEQAIPRPRVRGTTELRWHYYRWEKLTRKGWVPA
jgi:hypothetical protein